MARLKGPLFSMEASGTVANALTFAKWKGRDYVRRHAIPANPQSALQTGIRAVFKFITQDWTNLSAGNKADWEGAAQADNLTPLNAQIRDAIDRARRNLGWRQNLTDAEAAAVDAPTGPAAAAAPNSLVLTWTKSVDADADYCTAIYRETADTVAGTIDELIAVVTDSVETYTDKGLTTGTTYYYKLRHVDTAGKLGTLTASFNATPT